MFICKFTETHINSNSKKGHWCSLTASGQSYKCAVFPYKQYELVDLFLIYNPIMHIFELCHFSINFFCIYGSKDRIMFWMNNTSVLSTVFVAYLFKTKGIFIKNTLVLLGRYQTGPSVSWTQWTMAIALFPGC